MYAYVRDCVCVCLIMWVRVYRAELLSRDIKHGKVQPLNSLDSDYTDRSSHLVLAPANRLLA